MGEHPALGHPHGVGQFANGQTFQPVAPGYAESALDDQFAGSRALGSGGCWSHGQINSTTVRFIQDRWSGQCDWILRRTATIATSQESACRTDSGLPTLQQRLD
jgi:hypothetical protein